MFATWLSIIIGISGLVLWLAFAVAVYLWIRKRRYDYEQLCESLRPRISAMVARLPEIEPLLEKAQQINRNDPEGLRSVIEFAEQLLNDVDLGSDGAVTDK